VTLCSRFDPGGIAQAYTRASISNSFAGGGFTKIATAHHWTFIAELACATPCCVTLVSYPLAPHSPAKDSIPHLAKLYYTLMSQSKAADETTVFMGDSAGGNIVLCLPLYVVSKDPQAPLPDSILAIAPGADCRVVNEDIPKMDAFDPFLSHAYIQEMSRLWCKDVDPASPMVSPLLADLEILKSRNVRLDGIAGTWDVLWPDIKLLKEKAEKTGVSGSWYIAEEQMHCYPLVW
jgi:acetyl esterase/lipase